jgi:hypothetical protein
MNKYEIGRLDFDICYDKGYQENGLDYKFQILCADGKHQTVFEFKEVPPKQIDSVIAELYEAGWQLIQVTEDFNYHDDDHEDISIWFQQAYFHRPVGS